MSTEDAEGIRRITVSEVREAMDATGFSLRPHISLDPDFRCGCPIGIMAVQIKGEELLQDYQNYFIENLGEIVGLDPDYIAGFVVAFDGYNRLKATQTADMGYEDGLTIRKELLFTKAAAQ